jgi:hypothetical protein
MMALYNFRNNATCCNQDEPSKFKLLVPPHPPNLLEMLSNKRPSCLCARWHGSGQAMYHRHVHQRDGLSGLVPARKAGLIGRTSCKGSHLSSAMCAIHSSSGARGKRSLVAECWKSWSLPGGNERVATAAFRSTLAYFSGNTCGKYLASLATILTQHVQDCAEATCVLSAYDA